MSKQPSQGVKQKFEGLYEALSRRHAMKYARLIEEYEDMARPPGTETNEEEAAKDQELHRKMEEMLLLMKDMASKPNLCRSEPRYEEMLSIMMEKAGKDTKQKMKEDSEAMHEEFSTAGQSSNMDEEDQGKMKQQSSTSSSGKRSEDRQENEDCEFLGPPKSKKKHEVTREKKKPREDEGQKLNEKEEEMKRRTQKRLRKRSRSKDMCEFNEEEEERNRNQKNDES